jgi:hypothetical protein
MRRVDGLRELNDVWLGKSLHVQALELVLDHLEPLLALQANAEVPSEVVGLQPVVAASGSESVASVCPLGEHLRSALRH